MTAIPPDLLERAREIVRAIATDSRMRRNADDEWQAKLIARFAHEWAREAVDGAKLAPGMRRICGDEFASGFDAGVEAVRVRLKL